MQESVTQKHTMSCGLACVSFITGVPYDILAASEADTNLEQIGFSCPGLARRLKRYGHSYTWRKITALPHELDFRIGAIVFVDETSGLPYGHYMVRTAKGWMDPWINFASNQDVSEATSGFRTKLVGTPLFVVFPILK